MPDDPPMTTPAKPPARYSATKGARAGGCAAVELHHAVGHDRPHVDSQVTCGVNVRERIERTALHAVQAFELLSCLERGLVCHQTLGGFRAMQNQPTNEVLKSGAVLLRNSGFDFLNELFRPVSPRFHFYALREHVDDPIKSIVRRLDENINQPDG